MSLPEFLVEDSSREEFEGLKGRPDRAASQVNGCSCLAGESFVPSVGSFLFLFRIWGIVELADHAFEDDVLSRMFIFVPTKIH